MLNPVAGGCDPERVIAACRRRVADSGLDLELLMTRPDDEETGRVIDAVARHLTAEGALAIAAGGDGTVAQVADAMIRAGTAAAGRSRLGILPVGTANVLARELGVPLDLEEAIEVAVASPTESWLDAMHVSERHFLCQVGIGLDSRMIAETERSEQRSFGRLAYLASLVRAAFRHRAVRIDVEVDGRRFRFRAVQLVIANAATMGAPPLAWGPGIHPGDGKLDLCVFRAASPLAYLGTLWRLVRGRSGERESVRFLPVREEVTVRTRRRRRVQADGELIGIAPFTVRVVPRAVRVAVREAESSVAPESAG